MENASKALIIAASILIVLLLITFGVFIIQRVNPKSLIKANYEAETFNAQFDQYATLDGSTISGQEVKALMNAFRQSNVNYKGEHEVVWEGGAAPTPTTNGRYTVELKDNDEDGFYDTIAVNKV